MSRALRAKIGADEVTLHVDTSGVVTFDDGETVAAGDLRARVALAGDVAWVFVDGDVFEVEVSDARHEGTRRRHRSSEGALAAPMPATVSKVLVEVGRDVAAGDTLLLLEAMKMELPIKAPHAGRIAAIRCHPGDLVQPGVPLIEIASA